MKAGSLGYFFKNFRQKKKVYLLEGLVLVMIAIMLFSLMTVVISTKKTDYISATANAPYHAVYTGKIPSLDKLHTDDIGIKSFNRFDSHEGLFRCKNSTLYMECRWYESAELIPYKLNIVGEMPQNENEVLLLEDYKYYYGEIINIGDSLYVVNDDGSESEKKITGFYSFKIQTGQNGNLLFSVREGQETFANVEVEFDSEFGVVDKCQQLAAGLDNAQYYTNALRLGIFYQGEGDAGLLTVEVLLAVVVLIIATMMITGTIALNKSEKLKEGGILRSLGAKSSVILKQEITEAMLMGGASGIVGSIAAYGIMRLTLAVSGTGESENGIFHYEGFTVGIIVVTIYLMGVLIVLAVNHSRKINKSTVTELLSEQKKEKLPARNKKYRNPVTAYIKTSMKRNKGRIRLCIIVFTSSIFMIVLFGGVTDDMSAIFGFGNNEKPCYEVDIPLNTGYSATKSTEELFAEVMRMPAVADVCTNPLSSCRAKNIDDSFKPVDYSYQYRVEDGKYSNVEIEVYEKEELERVKGYLLNGSSRLNSGECLLVSQAYLIEDGVEDRTQKKSITDKKVGDSLIVRNVVEKMKYITELKEAGEYSQELADEYSRIHDETDKLNLKIAGTLSMDLNMRATYFCPVIIISRDYYDELEADGFLEYYGFKVNLAEGYDLNDLRESCYEIQELGQPDYFDMNASLNETVDSMEGLMFGLVVVMFFVGTINIFCIIMLSWERQKKEYAILSSVGAGRGRLMSMIVRERAYVGALSSIVGIVAGILIEKLVMKFMISDVKLPFSLPVTEIVISLLIMFAVSLLTIMVQAGILKNMNIADVLKDNE